ncbi:hypothetical protein KAR91_26885 [Candidatus Pacearchaeota archaeon]|nr:hypothetical protein [Candidatus Pacearchaeota archaeon]
MANEILVKSGTPIIWKASGGDYAITLASIAIDAARQGAKGDLGATRAARFAITVEINMNVVITTDNIIEFYWSSSPSGTAATQNDGAASGTDAAYTGSTGGSVDETKVQLIWIGNLVLTDDADGVIQQMTFVFSPPHRYGMPILVNKADQALEGDDDSHSITLTPIIDEVQ